MKKLIPVLFLVLMSFTCVKENARVMSEYPVVSTFVDYEGPTVSFVEFTLQHTSSNANIVIDVFYSLNGNTYSKRVYSYIQPGSDFLIVGEFFSQAHTGYHYSGYDVISYNIISN